MSAERCGATVGHGDTCSGQPGDPYLCTACVNRMLFERASAEIVDLKEKIKAAIKKSEAGHCGDDCVVSLINDLNKLTETT